MERLTLTPFGQQPVTAGLLASQMLVEQTAPAASFSKWELFHEVCAARHAIGVSDRDLTVLNALLSFLPEERLEEGGQLIVFPSNRTLSQRAHGMAESTLRRHVAALVRAGLILRHDSPNGKRYARRGRDGDITQAFGFDLRPLMCRAPEIIAAAEAARAAEETRKALRERCVLICRDAVKLLVYGASERPDAANWDALDDRLRLVQRALRRKLGAGDLEELLPQCEAALDEIKSAVMQDETEKMSGNDVEFERHHQNSKPNTPESESMLGNNEESMPLALILKACPEARVYRPEGIESWRDLIETAAFVRGMMGISLDAWNAAMTIMGPVKAATTVLAMLERAEEITSPGGYLRALTQKAETGGFSTGPMIMALLNKHIKTAA